MFPAWGQTGRLLFGDGLAAVSQNRCRTWQYLHKEVVSWLASRGLYVISVFSLEKLRSGDMVVGQVHWDCEILPFSGDGVLALSCIELLNNPPPLWVRSISRPE
jgi:hypothetical protein